MEWNLGINGIAVLVGMALVFGLVSQLVIARSTTRWIGVVGTVVYFAAGVFVSEIWFGWATVEELQPNIDGLSFDEVLVLGTLIASIVMGAVWYLVRRARRTGLGRTSQAGPVEGANRTMPRV
jgi:hypothetical protein